MVSPSLASAYKTRGVLSQALQTGQFVECETQRHCSWSSTGNLQNLHQDAQPNGIISADNRKAASGLPHSQPGKCTSPRPPPPPQGQGAEDEEQAGQVDIEKEDIEGTELGETTRKPERGC